jgi:hypothetical protein
MKGRAAGVVALACAGAFVGPAAAQVGTEGPRATSSAERAGNPCQTRACVKRVRLKRAGFPMCGTYACRERVLRKRAWRLEQSWKREWAAIPADWRAWALGTAYCETGGTMKPRIHTPSRIYHGLGQFDLRTWGEAGGTGDPHHASYHEQLVRMVRLARSPSGGKGRWPHCGRR